MRAEWSSFWRISMMNLIYMLISLCLIEPIFAGEKKMESIYDFTVQNIGGKEIPLSTYQGKVALIVNTASECGYTPQYADLQTAYDKYKEEGFVVLGFPSNDFGAQEPGSNEEIAKFCDLRFKVKFPLFGKIVVKGEKKAPLYKYLVSSSPKDPKSEVRWNFEKFLIGRDGEIIDRFYSDTKPLSPEIIKAIEKALK